jgi:hypothetical protein
MLGGKINILYFSVSPNALWDIESDGPLSSHLGSLNVAMRRSLWLVHMSLPAVSRPGPLVVQCWGRQWVWLRCDTSRFCL